MNYSKLHFFSRVFSSVDGAAEPHAALLARQSRTQPYWRGRAARSPTGAAEPHAALLARQSRDERRVHAEGTGAGGTTRCAQRGLPTR